MLYTGEAVSYTNWSPDHDSHSRHENDEDCVVLMPSHSGQWDDVDCHGSSLLGIIELDHQQTHKPLCEYGNTKT